MQENVSVDEESTDTQINMKKDFLAACESIAPLLNGDDTILEVAVPGVSDAIAGTIASEVGATDQTAREIALLFETKSMAYLLDGLRMADFLGHRGMIDGIAPVIASRLEGVSRDGMMDLLGLKHEGFSPDQEEEIRSDLEWISRQ